MEAAAATLATALEVQVEAAPAAVEQTPGGCSTECTLQSELGIGGSEAVADESCEKRQMLWEGMTGRGRSELVQQCGVPVVESSQVQKLIAAMMREVGSHLGELR